MTSHLDSVTVDQEFLPRTARARPRLWAGAALAVLLAGGAAFTVPRWLGDGSPASARAVAPPLASVTVSVPLRRDLARSTVFIGQFSAVDQVEIRAQVSGYLTEIHFTDGQIVHKGDLLFIIDQRPYAIALQQANAQLLTATSGLDLANRQIVRTARLKHDDFASGELLDQRVQQQRAAEAAVEQARAAVRSAELNLEFTRITAPLSGRISMHRASIGNLITGGQNGGSTTLLTTIVSLDPIHLDFDMSESDYLAYERFLQAHKPGEAVDRTVDASLTDEQGWTRHGTLDFIDNAMDRGSGTIHARATLPNPGLFIAPGQFARLRVPTAAPASTLLVPDEAIATDQSQKLVMVVAPDGTVVPKPVETGPLTDGLRVINAGLGRDDHVIINGLMHAYPGTKVAPQSGHITPIQG